jgi:uncharacterized Tic20 family protein
MNGITGEQKLLAILAHISYFLGGLGFIIAPLVIFLLKKDDPFVYEHAKQSLVAHLAILVTSCLVGLLCTLLIGVLLLPIVGILWLILIVTSIMAASKAFNGESYQYPFIQGFINKL